MKERFYFFFFHNFPDLSSILSLASLCFADFFVRKWATRLPPNFAPTHILQNWFICQEKIRNGLCLTSTGGRRNLPFLNQEEEEVALVALHWNGKFLPFPTVSWSVRWGEWKVEGEYGDYSVQLEGTCDDTGIPVKCPTLSGMDEIARETFHGEIRVMLYEKGALILDETSCEACLEVGGLPWSSMIWKGESAMKEPLKSLVMNVELERRASDILQLARVFVDIPGLWVTSRWKETRHSVQALPICGDPFSIKKR